MSLEQSLQLIATLSIHVLLLVMFFVLGDLSRIMGGALKKKPLYLGLYASSALIIVAQVMLLMDVKLRSVAIIFDIVAVLMAVIAAFYYWNWLLKDIARR